MLFQVIYQGQPDVLFLLRPNAVLDAFGPELLLALTFALLFRVHSLCVTFERGIVIA